MREALLVAVDHQEVLVPVADRQRLDAAHAAAPSPRHGAFDVDHLGAEVRQVLRADRALQPLGEVEDPDAFECLAHVFPKARFIAMLPPFVRVFDVARRV